jgi:predicted dithiol-disulfide oxidoreductase (DUF899 family)
VTKDYTFTAEDGSQKTLLDLFEGRSQLILYHFMFSPSWTAGCPSCSLFADHIPTLTHLNGHSTSFVAVSRAPIEKINAYKERMGWTFPWVSSHGTNFNFDFHVTQDENVAPVMYNFKTKQEMLDRGVAYFAEGEQPGTSVFIAGGNEALGVGEKGKVYHSYSTYARGGEHLIGTMSWLDMTPLGRQDGKSGVGGLGYKRHDEYTESDLKGMTAVQA